MTGGGASEAEGAGGSGYGFGVVLPDGGLDVYVELQLIAVGVFEDDASAVCFHAQPDAQRERRILSGFPAVVFAVPQPCLRQRIGHKG